ncbi:helix-turn-helix transcriptional regulator [uncultured Fusobacterium sp.]|jgi:transcriptional regulator with XRE-family HTH domain|uniref:helix-turn-helix domain-containing protein n=1 Tax=uncultured Fusobacterium sp. TaxID=159267 RepID=UPI0015A6DF2B|nr:helix-turn-helix transcriptional regulator [uncultured Fusobacterium sp.]
MFYENIYVPLYREVRLNFKNYEEVAKNMGVTRQWIRQILKKLENGQSLNLKTLEKICDGLGYEIVVRKKEEKNTAK